MDETSFEAPEETSSGALYVVGTPIGHPEDITLRALRILRESDVIVAEDTRVTSRLLTYHDIDTPLTSYNQHSAGGKARDLANRIEGGCRIALVSDAGMPGVADPGWELIRLCIARRLPVVPVPGPTAAIAALSVSGLPTQRFAFDGFPPRQRANRLPFFERLRNEARTVLLYESPRRLRETLEDLRAVLGPDRRIVVGRDLTGIKEALIRGTIDEVCNYFSRVTPRGEMSIVVAGRQDDAWIPDSCGDGEREDEAIIIEAA